LQEYFAKPVTYEDPIWMWEGDMTTSAVAKGLYPRDRTFTLPVELKPGKNLTLDTALLGEILDAYHRQTDGPRSRVISSRWGLHIIPAEARDTTGRWAPAGSLLDTRIYIPVAGGRPFMHFRALCDALTKASGIKIIPGSHWLDQFFAPNGIVPPYSRLLTEEEEKQISISWGANDVTAREALISLIELSATTLSWDFRCNPQPWDRFCVFNLNPIQILVEGPDGKPQRKSLTHDRIKRTLIYLPHEKPPAPKAK